ncbi:MAG: GDP-L-fucose synthase [Rickettsiales bacterium]|jgi:GDP-L-fucose synthase|nr:GDP-L-fucose synthase [Rickettsiales bacterium]
MNKDSKIYVAGHAGLVGSAIMRRLKALGYDNIITRGSAELDLTRQADVEQFFDKERPEYVFLAAAKVGGIMANKTYPADFIYINMMIAANVINAACKCGVKKLLNLGSSCIYPGNITGAMKESDLLTGPLEKTNEAYAIAKIAAIKMCAHYNAQYGTNFISVMPTNLYGPGDNFNMETAHIMPMLIRRFHLAKLLKNRDFAALREDLRKNKLGWGIDAKINLNDDGSIESTCNQVGAFADRAVLWGDGNVYREFMHSDDLSGACLYIMQNKDAADIGELINITSGTDILLRDLVDIAKDTVGFDGALEWDKSKPNGTYRKLMDGDKICGLGWGPKIGLKDGVHGFYDWYLKS